MRHKWRSMKAALKNLVKKSAASPFFWIYTLLIPAVYLERVYRLAAGHRNAAQRTAKYLRSLFPDLKVKHGPFQGMQFISEAAVGSTLLPKLLGSYEAELQPVLDQILLKNYSAIVDVGCAEGYYAIGLGLRFPDAQIYAFDTDEQAQKLCVRIGQINALAARLHVGAFCDAEKLQSIPFNGSALIISDCEGYELELFSSLTASFLKNCDLLIEVHDALDSVIGRTLCSRFESTHTISSIESIDDAKKVRLYRYPELEFLAPEERLFVLEELRGSIMEWLYMTPKASGPSRVPFRSACES